MTLALCYVGNGMFRALHPTLADRMLGAGEVKRWEVVDERSMASHRHYFACINEAWKNLPEHLADEIPNPEALRKYALIKTGFCHRETMVFANNGEALKFVAMTRRLEEFSVVSVEGKTVSIWTARSQKHRRGENGGMDKKEFQDSKDAVLGFISQLIGTDVASLERAAA